MTSNIPTPPVTSMGTNSASTITCPTAPHRLSTALEDPSEITTAALVLKDGTSFQGISFGAEKSISGECVFQTGKLS